MEEKEISTYLDHNKFVKIVINKNNKEKINYMLDFITKDIVLRKQPDMTVYNNEDGINLTVYWDFNYILVTNWVSIEAKLKKKLKSLHRRKLIEAFLITWI